MLKSYACYLGLTCIMETKANSLYLFLFTFLMSVGKLNITCVMHFMFLLGSTALKHCFSSFSVHGNCLGRGRGGLIKMQILIQ